MVSDAPRPADTATAARTPAAAVLPAALAAGLLILAMSGGGYAIGIRNPLGIAAWVAAGLAVAVRLWPLAAPSRAALVAAGCLLGFTVLNGLSALWADDPEGAVAELDRNALYLGIFVLVLAGAARGSAARWCDGLGAGLAIVGVIALASRLLPGLGFDSAASQFFPEGFTYLSYPVEYWNGLAVLIALALPLLLRTATTAGTLGRGLALAPIPALVCALFLTSSRGGMLAALIAIGLYVVLCGRVTVALAALAVAFVGSAAALAVLTAREYVVDGPFGSSEAIAEGRSAAIVIAAICVAVGVTWAVTLRDLRLPLPKPSRTLRRGLLAAGGLLVVVAVIAADPADKLSSFTDPPLNRVESEQTTEDDLTTSSHLTSGSSSGRWQFWSASLDQFGEHPVLGDGAGSYEAWWAKHGSISYFTRQAHSLYLETLGELGILGLGLILGFFAVAAITGARRLRGTSGPHRATVAALLAVLGAFAAAAGIDWMWELTVVAIAALVAIAVLVGPAADAPDEAPAPAAPRALRFAVPAAAVVAIVALTLPWLASREIRDSREAALAGDVEAAIDSAERAADFTPWAASPHLQRALALEGAGRAPDARNAVLAAVRHDPSEWRNFLVLARLERAMGNESAAQAALKSATELSPRSPVVAEAAGR